MEERDISSPEESRIQEELAHLFDGPIDPKTHAGRILRHLAEAHFSGRTEALKEYAIAVDVLGRPASFDPKLDSIVRVEVHKLRRLLRDYYEGEGKNRALRILVAPGGYRLAIAEQAPRLEAGLGGSVTVREADANGHGRLGAGPIPTEETAQAPAVPNPRRREAGEGRGGRIPLAGSLLRMTVAVGGIAILAVLLWWRPPGTKGNASGEVNAALPPAASKTQTTPGASLFPIRISAGATEPYTDRNGRVWSADQHFDGGRSSRDIGNQIVRFTRAPDLFRTRREGDFHYRIPAPPGKYEVRLHFAENLYGDIKRGGGGETSRMFRVSINGQPVLDPLDIVGDAGGPDIALTRVFVGVRPAEDGRIHIRFESLANEKAMVNGIEVLRGLADRALPRRIAVGTRALQSPEGEEWEAEDGYDSGRIHERSQTVTGGPGVGVFGEERFGNFRYRLPVVPGHRYTLTVWAAEQFFGVERTQSRHPDRQFDILADGLMLAENVRLIEEAGGPLKAWKRTFRGLTGTPQGYSELHFRPDSNYAVVNALEWVDEGPAR